MDQYSASLWGDTASFEALLGLYAFALIVGAVWFVLWRFRLFKPVFLWLSVGVMVLSELYVAPTVYMLPPAHEVAWYQDVVEISDRIEDDGFYRVKTDRDYTGRDFDVTLLGGLGYNALGHYTSLTRANYMTAIKQFGYTSYWMEVGNSGGTILTDALLSVKYLVERKKSGGEVYQGEAYGVDKTLGYLPLGVLSQADIIKEWKSVDAGIPRAEFQKRLANDFFGMGDFVHSYPLNGATLLKLELSMTDILRREGVVGL
jgi:hypothetical protein